MYSEKTVDVPVIGINFPEDEILRTFPAKVQVTFQIGLTQFKNVTAEDFVVVVDYEKLHEGSDDKCKPILMQAPSIVNYARLSPQEIEYIIEQKITFND